jgi:glycosyltransferase involved in cell wall biosynthesis
MKILLHSDSPRAGTGYGVQTALLASRLAADGHEVAVSCKWGHDIGLGKWVTPAGHTVLLYPRSSKTASSVDILHGHANHFFKGDPTAGWIITLVDVWGFTNPFLREFQMVAWVPIDHITVPPEIVKFHQYYPELITLSMSLHGQGALEQSGIRSTYIPLAVDTKAMRPTPFPEIEGVDRVAARKLYNVDDDAFVVGMVAMNKGNVFDRKGFSEAFHAFSLFHRLHQDTVLLLHTDPSGFDGIDLRALAAASGIPDDAIVYTDSYAQHHGFTPSMMSGLYTAMDVLLSPSHGEGFCVPLIEAQACGTPVIASGATAQSELVGDAGWLVDGQPQFDPAQACDAFVPYIRDIVRALDEAYEADLADLGKRVREFAEAYDADLIYERAWRPFIASLNNEPEADKPLMAEVAVVVPVLNRPQNVKPLVDSFNAHNDGTARLYFVCDADDTEQVAAIERQGCRPLFSTRGSTFAQKANSAYEQTVEPWIFLCGDDVEFTDGWIAAARALSDRYDVIGTNDSEPGRVRNPEVAAKRHADHWFTRRAYIDDEGSSLEGPGVFCPEAYYHWYTDKEIIGLARARGVFTPCLESVVIHRHPGFDGDEDARKSDPTYMRAVEWAKRDETAFRRRVPLIEQQRQTRGAA